MDKKLTTKRMIIKLICVSISIIILSVLIALNKNGMDTLKPALVITILAATTFSTIITALMIYRKRSEKEINISYQVNDFLFMIIVAIILIQFTFAYLYFPAQVQQTSMYPTLKDGQMVISEVDKDIQRFDIVVVYIDENLSRQTNGELKVGDFIVKRVIGLPGETVYYKDGLLYINDNLISEDFLEDSMITAEYSAYKNNCIPNNEYLLLGDHRQGSVIDGVFKPGSYDGRCFGTVKRNNIIGQVIYKRNGFLNWEKVI